MVYNEVQPFTLQMLNQRRHCCYPALLRTIELRSQNIVERVSEEESNKMWVTLSYHVC